MTHSHTALHRGAVLVWHLSTRKPVTSNYVSCWVLNMKWKTISLNIHGGNKASTLCTLCFGCTVDPADSAWGVNPFSSQWLCVREKTSMWKTTRHLGIREEETPSRMQVVFPDLTLQQLNHILVFILLHLKSMLIGGVSWWLEGKPALDPQWWSRRCVTGLKSFWLWHQCCQVSGSVQHFGPP